MPSDSQEDRAIRGSTAPLVTLGHVSRPNGLRGAVVLHVDPSMAGVLARGLEVQLSPRTGAPVRTTVRSAAPVRGGVRVTLDGVNNRNASEALVGAKVLVERSSLRLGEDEYLDTDLLGLEVVTPDGQTLGRIAEVVPTGANDVYVVRAEGGAEILIPAVSHAVLAVDLGAARMTVAAEALEYGAPAKPDHE